MHYFIFFVNFCLDGENSGLTIEASIINEQKNQTALTNQTVNFTCTSRSNAFPTFAWFYTNATNFSMITSKDLIPIAIAAMPVRTTDDGKHTIDVQNSLDDPNSSNEALRQSDESSEMLIVVNLTESDTGYYVCVAGNGYSTRYQYYYLNVLSQPPVLISPPSTMRDAAAAVVSNNDLKSNISHLLIITFVSLIILTVCLFLILTIYYRIMKKKCCFCIPDSIKAKFNSNSNNNSSNEKNNFQAHQSLHKGFEHMKQNLLYPERIITSSCSGSGTYINELANSSLNSNSINYNTSQNSNSNNNNNNNSRCITLDPSYNVILQRLLKDTDLYTPIDK